MIGIDMQMPDKCCQCPMSYWIQSGEHEGELMCNIVERQLVERQCPDLEQCIVDEWASVRPDNCPLIDLSLRLVKGE